MNKRQAGRQANVCRIMCSERWVADSYEELAGVNNRQLVVHGINNCEVTLLSIRRGVT